MAIMKVAQIALSQLVKDDRGRITAVVDTSKDFLKYIY
jgi:hypothetical protein